MWESVNLKFEINISGNVFIITFHAEKEPEKKEDKTDGGKKEVSVEKKITPAEYRRLHP